MATPVYFPEANYIMTPPGGFETEVASLPVRRLLDGRLVSCWQLEPEEIEEISRTRRIWLRIYTGLTHPGVELRAFRERMIPET